ncbi:HAD family hydrolase [Carboxylicivirga caseinilyticus]|uniref:HAD family hydrolase n=1 Tax=Carboxylicivirga caseinilyticus TaxID=3417572 RepID=UPI003D34E5F3|nr:HAD family phosphatase [Marinilabiliaceae bacterium A049]
MDLQRFKGIEAFLFDLGGVIIDIDVQKAIDGFKKIGLKGIESQITKSHHIGLFKAFERGDIDEREFLSNIKKETGIHISDEQIIDAWQSILVDFPIERVQILEKLHQDYPTYILSNTNGIHLQKFSKMAEGYEHIEELFTAAYYSYQLGCSKPEKCAFEKVIELSGLKPETTLFLDDSEINLQVAEELGFKTQLVTKSNSMVEIFK